MAKENSLRHNTDKYELVTLSKTLIIRRGGTFSLKVSLNETVDLKQNQILRLNFNYGK